MSAAGDAAVVDHTVDELLARFPDPSAADPVEFLGAQYDLGLAWVHFGVGSGGLGLAAGNQPHIDQRLRAVGAPETAGDFIGLHQCATALNAFGSDEQKVRFLRPIFTGEEHWCQMFSEPGAGSDLAGLATMAVRDGDEWTVNGQKVWTSGAREARWAILVARTDPEVPKHRGLTFFVCDMEAPGVDVRPLRQADGNSHFNEVFLTDVVLADWLRVGDVGQGWAISVAGLHSEREGTGDAFKSPTDELLRQWAQRADRTSPSARALRADVIRAWVDARVVELSYLRLRESQGKGGATPLGSLAKIAASEQVQRMSAVLLRVMGPAGQVGLDYDAPATDAGALAGRPAHMVAVRSRAMSIEGGTNEIQRNIIGERVLGLPGDVRVDKDRPWREVLRS